MLRGNGECVESSPKEVEAQNVLKEELKESDKSFKSLMSMRISRKCKTVDVKAAGFFWRSDYQSICNVDPLQELLPNRLSFTISQWPKHQPAKQQQAQDRNIVNISEPHESVMSLMSLRFLMFLRFSSHGCGLLIPRCPERAEPQTRDDLLSLSPREHVPTMGTEWWKMWEKMWEDAEAFKIFKCLGMPPGSPNLHFYVYV